MAVTIKSEHEIELMRVACRNLYEMFGEMEKMIRPGVSTWEINQRGEEIIRDFGCTSNFKNYEGYPAAVCVSVNEVVVHGIPSKDVILKEGDIVSLDAGMIWKGWHSDAARTYAVGRISPEKQQLIDVTRQSFFEGIRYARAGNHLHDISAAIQKYAESFGYGVIRDMVGHGIGSHMHEDPQIPNYRSPGMGRGIVLRPGMTLAIEPMIAMGTYKGEILDDGWTYVTKDRKPAAHYENTVLITDGDPEILTLPGWKPEN